MLERLLELVAEGGAHSYKDLTRQLSISQPLLEAVLTDLARLGYLRAVSDGCSEKCSACSIGRCAVTGPGRLWTLTDKGSEATARTSTELRTQG
jgi:hypothetical protein